MSLLLYVTSLEARAGKTALGAALGRRLLENGKRVGYFKPVRVARGVNEGEDPDAGFMRQVLGLPEPVSALAPAMAADEMAEALSARRGAVASRVKAGLDAVSQDKDVVIVEEGLDDQGSGLALAQASGAAAQAVGAKALLVVRPTHRIKPEVVVSAARSLGQSFIGVVLNAVPQMHQRWVRDELMPALSKQGITVLGVIPEERALLAVTVEDMVKRLEADVVLCADRLGPLVEHIMVGCLTLDNGDLYYRRHASKVVISRADRPDFQFAALETPTHALFLTGNADTSFYVLEKAENLKVPVVRTRRDTPATIAALEPLLAAPTFYYPQKLERMARLVAQHVDAAGIFKALGLNIALQGA
ncbi:MAG: AAA family ATPase [Dehalococcoidia bacterium]|nr:AAA family ATPase [Dehalococcoidia bacterium]